MPSIMVRPGTSTYGCGVDDVDVDGCMSRVRNISIEIEMVPALKVGCGMAWKSRFGGKDIHIPTNRSTVTLAKVQVDHCDHADTTLIQARVRFGSADVWTKTRNLQDRIDRGIYRIYTVEVDP